MKLLLYKMFDVLREGKSSIENYVFSDNISQPVTSKQVAKVWWRFMLNYSVF